MSARGAAGEEGEEEVRDAVGARSARGPKIAHAEDERRGVARVEEATCLSRRMLPVGVDGHGRAEALEAGRVHTGAERGVLAALHTVARRGARRALSLAQLVRAFAAEEDA